MPNFADLLNKPMDDVKRPPSLPPGTYYGTIASYEGGESSNKKTPFLQFNFKLTHAGDDIEPSELEGIDLAKKALRIQYYLTADAEYRLKEFLEALKIETSGRTFQSCLPETIGAAVMLEVVSRPNREKPTEPPFNEVRDARGVV